VKFRLRSLTVKQANRRRKLVRTPDFVNLRETLRHANGLPIDASMIKLNVLMAVLSLGSLCLAENKGFCPPPAPANNALQ